MTTNPVPDDPSVGQEAPIGTAGVLRSEERLAVSLPVRVREGLRVSKVVVVETVTQTVEVRREELCIEEIGADQLTLTTSGDLAAYDFTEQDFDLVLHEERVVVSTETVPVERVRVRTRVVTDQVEISDTVRREQVELSTLPKTPPPSR